jgi:hypothetical protein
VVEPLLLKLFSDGMGERTVSLHSPSSHVHKTGVKKK